MFENNDVIDNRYQVIEEIGRGGMGAVLRVVVRNTNEQVALKYCMEYGDEILRRRFSREVRFMASIDHAHVMHVLNHNLDHNPPYFTMPIALNSISSEIGNGLPENEAIEIFKQICLGIQAIHNATGTHRDIKPENAMRMPEKVVVVSDLGLVKLEPRDTTILTQTAMFLGTRAYCAPEQLLPGGSRGADPRTDIFQLGKTLYQLITGEVPVLIDTGRLPTGLIYIIQKATRQHPDQRYQTVGVLMDAVENYILAMTPGASPDREYEAALQEASGLISGGQYRLENLETLLNMLLRFSDDSKDLIEQFERIPDTLLPIMVKNLPESVQTILEAYCIAIEDVIGGYIFSYAEL